jgi:hypothetical protein
MKKIFLIAAAIAPVMVVGSSAGSAELPTFEARGFPISRHPSLSASDRGLEAAPKSKRPADCHERRASDHRFSPALTGCRDRAAALSRAPAASGLP